ncbi:zinc-binding dehydrogenase [Streptomyces sp. NPDC088560]|uniref:zinc-binding dehydrogenase n=1 Tax=Streptomyces sp. NPDC088560 TaxID=3365868 RepID=UPI00382759F3
MPNEPEEAIGPGLKTIAALAAQGALRPVIDSRFALDDFEDAFARPGTGHLSLWARSRSGRP